MSSLTLRPERAVPQQERASRRIESFLDVAAEIVAEVGYEAMTMSAVADRSGASIGALYRYFPDKVAVARTLLLRYAQQVDLHWASLIEEAKELSVEELADNLVGRMGEFAAEHPAYLPLLAAPIRFARDASVRQKIRDQFSKAFMARNPKLSRERALLISNVVVQVLKGLIWLYAAVPPRNRAPIIAEYKLLLAHYLRNALQG